MWRAAGLPSIVKWRACMSKLCLNMIVRNEIANLERCLLSTWQHIDSWVICDTGSVDGTQALVTRFFAERNIPGRLIACPFVNFEQARNEALKAAYHSDLDFDFLLLHDADMELVVEHCDFRNRLNAPGYSVQQTTADRFAYWNTRIVRRDVQAWYKGVTHEFLDLPEQPRRMADIRYIDHACGSNRVDKFERDARLLEAEVTNDPTDHRAWFYLAQSYRDGGRVEDAAQAYSRRAEMGGWAEEAWQARLQHARCLRQTGDIGGFVTTALKAFGERPWRAEPLYDLARHYREDGNNAVALLFCIEAMRLTFPVDDALFVESWVYDWGIREEFSIAAYYAIDRQQRLKGHEVCAGLTTDHTVPQHVRDLAAKNLQFYNSPGN